MAEKGYTTNVGDYLIVWLTGCIGSYIAQVVQNDPLEIKVQETGPYAHLKDGDFIIREQDTMQAQRDDKEDTCVFLAAEHQAGRRVMSGLESLGVTDGRLRLMLPV